MRRFCIGRFVVAPFLSGDIYASAVFVIRRLCCAVYSAPFLSALFIPRINLNKSLASCNKCVCFSSVSIEQHDDSERVEKFVRYVARCRYRVGINYIHCERLEDEDGSSVSGRGLLDAATVEQAPNSPPQKHVPAFLPDVAAQHEG